MRCLILILLSVFLPESLAIELPPGLRPAKAIGESQQPIVPNPDEPAPPPNVRTPPNLSLRSRMIAALNSRSADSHPPTNSENNDGEASLAQKAPVIFQKGGKRFSKSTLTVENKSQETTHAATSRSIRVTVPPPEGKNYGVNTLLQTNLVDSKGRIMKGVSSIPIRVPSSSELRNAKSSRASASQVETDAEKVVPVKFGRAERRRFR
ncbi:hypothetical protein DdX_03236 [Ditylenchus destructor]|uniref:Uncharacterized protein n=1 Tax=Ditylenchus destructor TaxID=166010 RepID=A0AAD4NE79_9BILA|nr:hypothetical protein DdX_03236 [Ditylenchus destructor]